MERQSEAPAGDPVPPRRAIRLAWAAGVLPFVLVVAVAVYGRQHGPNPMRLLAESHFPPPLYDLEAGTDRRGDHVALIDGQQRLHVLGLRGGRLTDQTLPLPWAAGDGEGAWLVFAPSRNGELLDLRVNEIREDDSGEVDTLPNGRAAASALFVQGPSGFAYAGRGPDGFVASPSRAPAEVYDGETSFHLRNLGGETPLTQVVDRRGHVQLLHGDVFRTGDLTGNGRLELLAAERSDQEQFGLTLRLYSRHGDAFREVWTGGGMHPRTAADVSGDLRALAVMADLDGDGRCDLIVGDSTTGKVDVMRWEAPADANR